MLRVFTFVVIVTYTMVAIVTTVTVTIYRCYYIVRSIIATTVVIYVISSYNFTVVTVIAMVTLITLVTLIRLP